MVENRKLTSYTLSSVFSPVNTNNRKDIFGIFSSKCLTGISDRVILDAPNQAFILQPLGRSPPCNFKQERRIGLGPPMTTSAYLSGLWSAEPRSVCGSRRSAGSTVTHQYAVVRSACGTMASKPCFQMAGIQCVPSYPLTDTTLNQTQHRLWNWATEININPCGIAGYGPLFLCIYLYFTIQVLTCI